MNSTSMLMYSQCQNESQKDLTSGEGRRYLVLLVHRMALTSLCITALLPVVNCWLPSSRPAQLATARPCASYMRCAVSPRLLEGNDSIDSLISELRGSVHLLNSNKFSTELTHTQ